MGKSLLVSYVYDNFDIDFKTHLPTVEKSGNTLEHLTAGTLIQLEHGVTPDHLKCSDELWARSPLNPLVNVRLLASSRTVWDFLTLHPEHPHPSGLTRQQMFHSWMFYRDLCTYGPKFFQEYQSSIKLPDAVESIPLVKMRHAPAKAMDINQSKVSGNIQAIEELMRQGGIGDPTVDDGTPWESSLVDLREHVALFHGDLGTAERVQSLLEHRSLEKTYMNRFQAVVYVFGLFHFKMAAADVLWRILIEPKDSREDPNSLMQFLAQHRPRETGRIGSKPGFRRMHEVINHEGTALRLDAWRTELRKQNPAWKTLELFAQSRPSEETLQLIANHLALQYVAGASADVDIYRLRQYPKHLRDQQRENMLLVHKYLLLYEETSHAMNHGDIGRLETLFVPWIPIFQSTGKHKYATYLVKFLNDVHWVYPKDLR